jgi:hypothetical protein
MQIKFVDDPSVQAAPAGFQNALNEAASVISAKLINDPITVTLDIGYGEVGGSPITGSVLAAAAPTRGTFLTYDQLVSDLHNQALSANDRTFLAHLPASDPSGGNTANWFVSAAQEKALGLINPTSTEVDGEVGVSANFTYTFSQSGSIAPGSFDLVGILEHEMTHALGRYAPPGFLSPFDLTAYDPASGKLDLNNGPNSRYFSIDGGAVDLAGINGNSDPADFSGLDGSGHPITDPFNAFLSPGTTYAWTNLDSTTMDVLGYQTAPINRHHDRYTVNIADNQNPHESGTGPANALAGLFGDTTLAARDFEMLASGTAVIDGTGGGGDPTTVPAGCLTMAAIQSDPPLHTMLAAES